MKNLNLSSVNFITILVEFCPFFFFKDFHLSPFFCVFWMNHVSPFLFACQFFVYCLFILLILGILSVLLFFFGLLLHSFCMLVFCWSYETFVVTLFSIFLFLLFCAIEEFGNGPTATAIGRWWSIIYTHLFGIWNNEFSQV